MTAPTPEQREAAKRLWWTLHPVDNLAQALADERAAGRREGIEEAAEACRVVEAQRMAQAQEMRWQRSRVASDYCRAMTAGASEARAAVRALLDAPAERGGGE